MQKTRFEGQAESTRAAKWAVGPNIWRAALIFAILMPLSGTITACTPAKEPVVEMKNEGGLRVRAHEGAIMPAGLDRIEVDMTQAEVMQILSPLYDVSHAEDATAESPVVDIFIYEQDGKEFYGEVEYDGPTVDGIRFGFENYFVFQ